MAENATHTLHNLLTLRGALIRDPHVWAHYLTEAIELFAGESWCTEIQGPEHPKLFIRVAPSVTPSPCLPSMPSKIIPVYAASSDRASLLRVRPVHLEPVR